VSDGGTGDVPEDGLGDGREEPSEGHAPDEGAPRPEDRDEDRGDDRGEDPGGGIDDGTFDEAAFGEGSFDEGGFDDDLFDDEPLDEHETELVRQDLTALATFRATFELEGYRGVAVWCHDCVEEHYFPWDMLRENLQLLLETGETPVHEPAFQPEPERYVPWDYARGYVDALEDTGVRERLEVDGCARCGITLEGDLARANFCPRCGDPLLRARIREALTHAGLSADDATEVLRWMGLPTT
jgi:hypothetical protein